MKIKFKPQVNGNMLLEEREPIRKGKEQRNETVT
jgi:hypothetical protein